MNSGDDLAAMERQLREQADQLLSRHGQEPPASSLLAEHHRRRRRRIVRCACGIAAVLMLVGTGGVLHSLRQADPLADQHESGGDGRSVVQSHDPGKHSSPLVVPPDATPDDGPPVDRPPQFAAHPAADANGPPAWPVLITVPEGDKQRVIATGIYVPEHSVPLNLLDLTPGEQHAVRQVLDIPQESISHDPI
jgi:hypothetical protein